MDEPVVEPVVEPVAEPVTPVVEPVSSEYSFEAWRQGLGEDIREEKSLQSFKNAKDQNELTAMMAKSFVNTKKMVGANTIALPTDISSQGEWDEYHKAGGRPETAADYDLKLPDEFPEELATRLFPETEVTKWKERLFKNGVSQKGADSIVKELAGDLLTRTQASEQAKADMLTESANALSTEYGAAFDQKMHMGDMAIEDFTGGDVEMKEALAYLKDDPNAVRMMVHFGGMLAEGKPPNFSAIPTPSDYQDQIDTLMADPLYTKGTQQQRMKIANKIQEIKKLQLPESANT